MTDYILETSGLTKEFRGFVAVNDVNLRVGRGSIHGLIGPNGAGKTTCFNLLTKFLPVTRGSIRYEGQDITGKKPAEIARLGLVRSFQISAVFPHLSVLENVRVALQRQRSQAIASLQTLGFELLVSDDFGVRRLRLVWLAGGLIKAAQRHLQFRVLGISLQKLDDLFLGRLGTVL